jgi:hypothetical protein
VVPLVTVLFGTILLALGASVVIGHRTIGNLGFLVSAGGYWAGYFEESVGG